ncbi:MAG: hypothetical protein ABIH03_05745 [Pseudomonadota bacterium]
MSRKTTFHVALFGRESLPSTPEILAVFSWRVIRTETRQEAISIALAESGLPASRWVWALLKWPPNRLRPAIRIDAIRIIDTPAAIGILNHD